MSEPTSSTNAPRVAVVGGGISGLTAAYRLTRLVPAAQVTVLEASERLGGMLCTRSLDGYQIEFGADSFLNKLPAAVELCEELGLGDEIVPTNSQHRRALVLCDGNLQPVPSGFVQMQPELLLPMLRSPILSWVGKQRLLGEWLVPRSEAVDRDDFDESVASFATRRLGKEVFERLVQPLLAGIYTADPYKLSVAATMPTAVAAERDYGSLRKAALAAREAKQEASQASGARYASFVTLRRGLVQLIEALARELSDADIRLNAPVEKLEQDSNGCWLVTPSGASALPYDGVVVALPAPRASELLAATDEQVAEALGGIKYASSAVAVLRYRREQIGDALDAFGIVVPTVEQRQIVAASYLSVKFPDRAADDEVVIRVFVGGALQPELLHRSDDEIVELARREVSKILDIQGKPLRSELIRWNEKMPQYHVGHVQLIDHVDTLMAKHHGIELAGNAYRGVGIPQCVASGNDAARRLARAWC